MVVYIITKLELGGAQKVCLALTEGLAAKQVPVTLVSGTEGVLVEQAKASGKTILLPSFKREIGLRSFWAEIKNFFILVKLLRDIKKNNPDIIVHTHSTKAGIIGRWAAFFSGIKKRIHTVHGYGFHDFQSGISWLAIYFLELITSFITTQFICVSEKDRQTGARLFPWFIKKSTLIRAAVDWETFNTPNHVFMPAQSFHKQYIIGTIACFKPQKNLFDLLKAFKIVHQVFVKKGLIAPMLHIIGDGIQRKEIEHWISQENLTASVILLGWQTNVASWMRSWHIFALSSLWEGLPCSIIEARLCKLPVIVYRVGGVAEVVTNGENGFLIEGQDYQALAARIQDVLQDDNLRQRLSMYGDNLDDFNNTIMVQKHLNLYRTMMSKAKQSAYTS